MNHTNFISPSLILKDLIQFSIFYMKISDKYSSPTKYTQLSSGNRLPNRPTTPGPYFGIDRPVTPGPYIAKRPNTPGPFTRESWKRTNQKFNYTKFNKYGTHETFV